jgi:hypothetical protein
MSTAQKPFSIDLSTLKSRQKDTSAAALSKADTAGEAHGFVDRSPKKRRGRPASPRTAQIHAWVLPEVYDSITAEWRRTGKTNGALIEEAWELYLAHKRKDPIGRP